MTGDAKGTPDASTPPQPRYRSLVAFLVILPLLLLYLLVSLLGLDFRSDGGKVDTLELFGQLTIPLTQHEHILLITMLAGSLGSYIHAVTSFTSYVGNRTLRSSWVLWYFLRPIMGAVLAVIFYFLIAGGFLLLVLDGNAAKDLNPFGVAALSSLVGMFSKQAIDKMREVFDSLFKAAGDAERTDKLEEKRLVEDEMIRRSEIAGYDLKDTGADAIKAIKFKDLSQLVGPRVTRVPVFAPDGSLAGILHKSLIHEYLAKEALSAADAQPPLPPDYDKLTLGTVLDSDLRMIQNVAIVAQGTTLGEAKRAMQRIEGCQDVFVTDSGTRDGKVLGWLTNGTISRAIAKG